MVELVPRILPYMFTMTGKSKGPCQMLPQVARGTGFRAHISFRWGCNFVEKLTSKSFNFNVTLLLANVVFYENFRTVVHEFKEYFFVSILVLFSLILSASRVRSLGDFVLTMKKSKEGHIFLLSLESSKKACYSLLILVLKSYTDCLSYSSEYIQVSINIIL